MAEDVDSLYQQVSQIIISTLLPFIMYGLSCKLWYFYNVSTKDSDCDLPLPPGSMGVPLVGETLDLIFGVSYWRLLFFFLLTFDQNVYMFCKLFISDLLLNAYYNNNSTLVFGERPSTYAKYMRSTMLSRI